MTPKTPWRRLAALATLAVLATAGIGVGGPAGAQDDSTEPEATAGPPELTPGAVVPDDRGLGVVHSWALAPAGAGNGSQAGDRADLSYEMAPGTEVTDAVTLFNLSNVALTFDIYATDARNNADGAFAPLGSHEEPTDVGTWVTLPLGRLAIPAGQQATLPITIKVPKDAEPGDHAGAILAANAARGSGADGRVVNLDRRTGTRLYVRVDGQLNPELAVAGLKTTYTPSLNPRRGAAKVAYRIENRGNVRLAGTHRAKVSGPFGLFASSADEEEFPELLPGESMTVVRTLDDVSATGLAFTDVDLVPVAPGGELGELEPAGRAAIVVAIPWTIVAALIAAALAWYARRAYLRHRRGEIVVGHLPT